MTKMSKKSQREIITDYLNFFAMAYQKHRYDPNVSQDTLRRVYSHVVYWKIMLCDYMKLQIFGCYYPYRPDRNSSFWKTRNPNE